LTYPSEKYEFVSWDDDSSQYMEKIKHVPNHQPDRIAQQSPQQFHFMAKQPPFTLW
jgi:hypothetical protein